MASYLETAVDIAREAGSLLSHYYERRVAFELKGDFDLVTEADRASEKLVVERLRSHFPSHSIVAEEGGNHEGTSEFRWYVDPLDGTTNFAHGFPMFNVTLAVEQAGELIAGVIFDPLRQEMFAAEHGGGAYLNNRRIHVDKASYLPGEPVNITATFPYGYSGIFPTSLTMYFVITDMHGITIYDMKKHGYWLMVITSLIVGPGYSRSFTWNQVDDSGKPVIARKWLNAVVIVPAWDRPLSASTEFEINPMPASFKDSLAPGWNFVSIPLVNDSLSAGRLGLGTGSIIVGWNTVSQSYSSAFVVGVSPEFMDFEIVAGNAYFIWSPQGQPMTVRGCSPDYFTKFSTYLNVPSGGGSPPCSARWWGNARQRTCCRKRAAAYRGC